MHSYCSLTYSLARSRARQATALRAHLLAELLTRSLAHLSGCGRARRGLGPRRVRGGAVAQSERPRSIYDLTKGTYNRQKPNSTVRRLRATRTRGKHIACEHLALLYPHCTSGCWG